MNLFMTANNKNVKRKIKIYLHLDPQNKTCFKKKWNEYTNSKLTQSQLRTNESRM